MTQTEKEQTVMDQILAYAIVGKNGKPVLLSGHLPIYWLRKVALQEAEKAPGSKVVRVAITDGAPYLKRGARS